MVAGVEPAQPASPRAQAPAPGGLDLRPPTPATRRCYPRLNQAGKFQVGAKPVFR